MTSSVVIAGAGQAGLQCAASLRQSGFEGAITLVGEEFHLPYQRPPLSKTYMTGDKTFDSLVLKSEGFFQKNGIVMKVGCRVTAIDRVNREVVLDDGASLGYDYLVLATGARNRVLPVVGAGITGVHQLRGVDDADALRSALSDAKDIAIVGAGFIGLEVAASVRALGKRVTVVEAGHRVMGRTVSAPVSDFFLRAHRAMGADIRLDTPLQAILGEPRGSHARVAAIRTAGHDTITADLVLIAAGVMPNDELAREAGLAHDNGILVDAFMTTSDPGIFAIGDCAVFESRFTDKRVRLESVQNAIDQAKTVAARILGGSEPYDSVPWFWSDQGRYKLQIVGLTSDADSVEIVRPDENDRERLVAYCFKDDRLIGIETVNRPGEHMLGRRILAHDLKIARSDIEDHSFDLKAHVADLMER